MSVFSTPFVRFRYRVDRFSFGISRSFLTHFRLKPRGTVSKRIFVFMYWRLYRRNRSVFSHRLALLKYTTRLKSTRAREQGYQGDLAFRQNDDVIMCIKNISEIGRITFFRFNRVRVGNVKIARKKRNAFLRTRSLAHASTMYYTGDCGSFTMRRTPNWA